MRPMLRIRAGRLRLRQAVATLVVAGLSCIGLVAVAAAPASAASACQVAYTVSSDWGSGFTAAITITNTGSAISSWTLGYSYGGNQQLTSGWSGNWSQAGANVTVTNASWNGSLAAGASTQIGANFNYSGTNTAPTSFTINGSACNGTGTGGGGSGTPTVSLTSPATGASFTAPATVSLAATAAETGGTISKVEFFNGTTLLGTATASPYTFSWTNVPAGSYSLTAEAFDAAGGTATSSAASVTVTAATTPSVVASPASLSVAQGGTGTFGVSLSKAPTANVTVTVARGSGNTGLSVTSGGTLTFTPANFATAQTVTVTADGTSTGAATFTATGTGFTGAAVTVTETSTAGATGTLLAGPATFSTAQGTSENFGVSLSAAPSGTVTVAIGRTSGNTGLAVSAGAALTFTTSNWQFAQPVTVTADSASTGAATFTVSSAGFSSVSVTATETAAGSTATPAHVVNPFTGSTWYVNPSYTAEVATSAATASGTLAAQMTVVGKQSTGVWLDHIGAIYGGSQNNSLMSLQAHLQTAVSQESGSTPILVPLVIYDLPNRDCAALASNGELSISNNGLADYEQDYINPIAQTLTDFEHTNIRVVAIIEPDSLPNLVTNLSDAPCAQANSSGAYVSGVQYALNKLHAIPNVYNYVDIAHSAWLGWPSNMGPAVSLLHSVAAGTTAGVASVDGFISDTANTTPTVEPFMTATENVGGQPIDANNFYQFNPFIDELSYDQSMYSNLVASGFPSTIGMLIDTSRNGWGGPNRPTAASTSTDQTTFVNASKVDKRPFRGDWCNQNGAGLGAFPQANPMSSFTNLYAYVWIKPPGESDGDYPTATHSHGDPHCDPNGTNTDGNGNTYSTGSIPGFDIPAGQWFPAQFQQLVQNAFPAVP
jgi:cellulose 1,4-beta-cellobiosidase